MVLPLGIELVLIAAGLVQGCLAVVSAPTLMNSLRLMDSSGESHGRFFFFQNAIGDQQRSMRNKIRINYIRSGDY